MTTNRGGFWLALGATAIFAAWLLMPDAATNDAAHILAAVGAARGRVRASALIQLAGSALLVPGLLALARDGRAGRAGPLLSMWGAVGMAADAVFHQLAVQLTAPTVDPAAALAVMQRMQTDELAPHVPLLLAFLVAAPVLGWALRHDRGSRARAWLLLAPLVTIPLVLVAVRVVGVPRRIAALVVLAEVCAGLAALGLRALRPPAAPG